MALNTVLNWKNRDSSSDLNDRIQGFVTKGITTGGDITPSGVSLEVTVDPFTLMTFDGMLAVSDAAETLTVSDAQINYVCARIRYVDLGSTIAQFEVLSEAAYLADPDQDHLHVICTVDLSGGGFVSVPGSAVSYVAADLIDKVERHFWREPVDTMASLPTEKNRNGDVRLVLDTGSLYWWDEPGTTWQVFDEVPLQTHRDHEHTNGITGDSDATTLEPGVLGTDLTVAAVPGGSAYTVNGRFVTAPAVPTTVSAGGIGAVRGLLQLAFDQTGAVLSGYRISKDADPLDIAAAQIIDISDNHTSGTYTLLYDNAGGTLQWAGGVPVAVVTGNEYMLFNDDGTESITVNLVGALPGVSVADNYTVAASLKQETSFLAGYWFWDGAVTLSLGTDKRVFGNLGEPQLNTDVKTEYIEKPMSDLREVSIYSGGAVEKIGAVSLDIRVESAVCYFDGRRVVSTGSYSGITVPDNQANLYIYVDTDGATQVATVSPDPTETVLLATAASFAGDVFSIVDERTPKLVIGKTTKETIIQTSSTGQVRWDVNALLDIITFEKNGSTADTRVGAGEFFGPLAQMDKVVGYNEVASEAALWTDNAFGGAPPHRFEHDDIANPIYIHRYPADSQVEPLMFGSATPSILGALRFAQEARANVRGSVTPMTVTRIDDSNVEVSAGSFVDGYGRLIEVAAPVTVPVPVDGARVVHWDPNGETFDEGEIGNLLSYMDPFAVVVKSGGVILPAEIIDCQRHSSNEFNRTYSTIGPLANGPQGSQFENLEAAMLNSSCYAGTGGHENRMPTEFVFVGALSLMSATGKGIDFTDPWWGAVGGDRVKGALVHSRARDTPLVQWTVEGPGMAEMNGNMQFRNLAFYYSGPTNTANDDVCVFKNPGFGLSVDDCTIGVVSNMTHVVYYDGATVDLTDRLGSGRHTNFTSCNFDSALAAGAASMFDMSASTVVRGTLTIEESQMDNGNAFDVVVDLGVDDPQTKTCRVVVRDTSITNVTLGVFNHTGSSLVNPPPSFHDSPKVIDNCTITPTGSLCQIAIAPFAYAIPQCDVLRTNFKGDIRLFGARNVQGCFSDSAVLLREENNITDCDFSQGDCDGRITFASNSLFQITTGTNFIGLQRRDAKLPSGDLPEVGGVYSCSFRKTDPVNDSSRVLAVNAASNGEVVLVGCKVEVEVSSGTPSDDYMILLEDPLRLIDCDLIAPANTIVMGSPDDDSRDLTVLGCRVEVGAGGSFYSEFTDGVSTSVKTFIGNTFSSTFAGADLFECGGLAPGDTVASHFVFSDNTVDCASLANHFFQIRDCETFTMKGNKVLNAQSALVAVNNEVLVGSGSGGIVPNDVVIDGNIFTVTNAFAADATVQIVPEAANMVASNNSFTSRDAGLYSAIPASLVSNGVRVGNSLINTGAGGSTMLPIAATNDVTANNLLA